MKNPAQIPHFFLAIWDNFFMNENLLVSTSRRWRCCTTLFLSLAERSEARAVNLT